VVENPARRDRESASEAKYARGDSKQFFLSVRADANVVGRETAFPDLAARSR
jgi:hypothetical protein